MCGAWVDVGAMPNEKRRRGKPRRTRRFGKVLRPRVACILGKQISDRRTRNRAPSPIACVVVHWNRPSSSGRNDINSSSSLYLGLLEFDRLRRTKPTLKLSVVPKNRSRARQCIGIKPLSGEGFGVTCSRVLINPTERRREKQPIVRGHRCSVQKGMYAFDDSPVDTG